MSSSVVITAVSEPRGCGEGPHWNQISGSLLYVDIPNGQIHRYFPKTKRHQVLDVEKSATGVDVSFALPVEGHPEVLIIGHGRSIAAVKWSPAEADRSTARSVVLETVEDGCNTRFNDAKCDPKGRVWAGTMGLESSPGVVDMHKGSLYKCGRAQRPTKMLEKISISNGLAWTADKKTFYYIDSLNYQVEAFDYDMTAGEIGNRRTILDFKKEGLKDDIPDGMTIDVDGNLWVCCFNSSKLLQVDPSGRTLLRVIELPAYNITSACWGGPNFDELYVTSANKGLSPDKLKEKPLSGSTFQITGLGTKGFPPTEVKLCDKVREKINAEFKRA